MASTAEIAETKQQQELLRAPGRAEMQSDLFSEPAAERLLRCSPSFSHH
jgi:hypothetical protein